MKKSLLIFATLFCFFLLPHSAQAALQFVGSASATGNSAAYNISLTSLTDGIATAPAAGDLVIIVTGFTDTGVDGNPGVTTAGFTEVADLFQTDTNSTNFSVNYKIMTATPDTTVSCNGSGTATDGAVCIAYVWRGVDQTTPLDVTSVTAGSISDTVPNCGSITPITSGAVVICSGLGASSAVDAAITAPAGYSNATSTQVDPGTAPTMAIASKAWTSGAEDPAVWTNWAAGTNAQNSWAAVTMALRPVVAPTVATLDAINITSTSTTLKGTILNIGSASISQYGFASSTVSTLSSDVSTTTTNSSGAGGNFSTAITGLSADTTYYYRAYASNGDSGYGGIASFATRPATIERTLRLFEGQRIKLVSGRLVLNQSSPIIAVSSGASGPQTIYLTANSDGTCGSGCWTVPSDWSNVDNTIEAIGAGGNGLTGGSSTGISGSGGGAGAYAAISNLSLTPGAQITFAVGAGGSETDTQFKDSSTLVADAGLNATSTSYVPGGTVANSVGTTKYAGGRGSRGTSGPGTISASAGGGGGAGSPNGNGANAGTATSNTQATGASGGGGSGGGTAGTDGVAGSANGRDGGNNFFATGGGIGGSGAGPAGSDGGGGAGGASINQDNTTAFPGGSGGAGTEWDATHGAGGGGGGGGAQIGVSGGAGSGGAGGNYGGGGGGGSRHSSSPGTGGSGASGIIVITYTPPTRVFLAANSDGTCGSGCWTVPSNFSTTHNSVEVIGGGGGGGGGQSCGGPCGTHTSGAGGGAGAYSKVTSLNISGSITFQIGAGGAGGAAGGSVGVAGGDTWFNAGTCAGSSVCAKGGGFGAGTALTHGSGGLASGGIGSGFNGGDGADGISGTGTDGGAGGGAAGPNGAGGTAVTTTGGTGDNSSGGTGGTAGANPGGNGTEWDSTHGSGGGGGGGAASGSTDGGAGGNYGGGGGGGAQLQTGGAGTGGLIVITYTAQ